MSRAIRILTIDAASDGTGNGPAANVTSMDADSEYYLEKIAERWAKDMGCDPGFTYRLDRLPTGYGGYAKRRGDSKHIDRYLYGHPKGVFRSMNELYPHFKHLQDTHSTTGCPCKLCGPNPSRTSRRSTANGTQLFLPSQVQEQEQEQEHSVVSTPRAPQENDYLRGQLPEGRPPDVVDQTRGPQVDEEGTPDIYRSLLDRLRELGPDHSLSENILDRLSPDWRTGNQMLLNLLNEWQALPSYVPRVGELVLFVRHVPEGAKLAWNADLRRLHWLAEESHEWLTRPQWEAGVVTQMPVEAISPGDLAGSGTPKQCNVNYSGFRVEPIAAPLSDSKFYAKQHKFLPLSSLRPLWHWKECVGEDENNWHPTIKHALTVSNSFCLVSRFNFRGTWPDATVFARAVYLGPELVMVGDTVRLVPRPNDPDVHTISDVMLITSIRLRFVNLEDANNNDYDSTQPYNTCLHICGRAYTLNPIHAHQKTDTQPVPPSDPHFPHALLASHGTWYPILPPEQPKSRLELPYTRVMGRCHEPLAQETWFTSPPPSSTFETSSFRAVNHSFTPPVSSAPPLTLSHGLSALRHARNYSLTHDPRIDRRGQKCWYWADTRIQQLDLREVNGKDIPASRTPRQLAVWRRALRILDGRKAGIEEYQALRMERERDREREVVASASVYGLVNASAPGLQAGGRGGGEGSSEEEDEEEDETEPEPDASKPDEFATSIQTTAQAASEILPEPSHDVIMLD